MEHLIKRILEQEKLDYKQIMKSTSGFTNVVYFVDSMVIKIALDEEKKKKLEKEINIYKNIKLNNIPQYIASGLFDNCLYLIISKVNGRGLFSVWHSLSDFEKEKCIEQISKVLKTFNNQNANFLDKEYKIYDWENFVIGKLKENKQGLDKLGIDTKKISYFIENNDLFKDNSYGLVYNDAHFDNFIYDNGNVSMIDFDRVIYAPIDYEMLIFKTMCDNPSKFASEEDEANVFDEDFVQVYDWFKKYYKELFMVPNIEQRIKTYQFNYLCEQALKMKNRAIGNQWAEELVNNFDV